MESNKKDLLTIKLKLVNPTSTQPLENFADNVKTNRNETQTKCTTDIRSGTRQNRDSRNILLIKTNQKFRDSIKIKRAFASIYPNKKLLYAIITARGQVYILSLQHQRRLTVFCRVAGLNFLAATRQLVELVTGMNSTAQ